MTIQTDIQALYIAYFNRPADFLGLQYWEHQVELAGGSVAAVANAFSASDEYKLQFEGLSTASVINTIYQNLFGREAEPDAISYWGTRLDNGTFNIGNIANSILVGAQNDDLTAINNKKTAAQAFYDSLDTTAEIEAYAADSSAVKAWLKGITDDASLEAATSTTSLATLMQETIANAQGLINVGTTYTLTAGVDTLTGTAKNDKFIAGFDGTDFTLGGLDAIDGGAGTDTLQINDTTGAAVDLSSVSVQNIEVLALRSVAGLKGDALDVSEWTGLTKATIEQTTSASAAYTITAGTGTTITLTDKAAAAAAGAATIVGGGGDLIVNTKGAVTVGQSTTPDADDANAFTSASIKGAAGATITDNSGAAGAVGSKLTTVTLNGVTAASTITGKGVTTLNLANIVNEDVTLVNATAKHALTLNLDGVTADKGDAGLVTDAEATTVTINAVADSAINLAAAKATALNVAGAGDVTLGTDGDNYAALKTVTFTGAGVFTADLSGAAELTTVTSSAATGTLDVTIAGTNSAAAGAAAQSVTGGAGDDKVTITGTLGKGSTLSLGGGSDVVAVSGAGVIAAEAVVDAGAGTDTLGLTVVDATNVGVFKNFELFDVAGILASFDQEILDTNNDVTGFVGSAAVGGAVTLQNLGAGVGFTVTGDMDATVVTLQQKTAGAITITSDVDSEEGAGLVATDAAFATNATTVTLAFDNDNTDAEDNTASLTVTAADATAVTVQSGGAEVVNTAVVNGDKITSITVTGDQHLVLTASGNDKLASIDASAATGGTTVTTSHVLAGTASAAAGTIKLGSGDDIINLSTGNGALALTAAELTSAKIQTVQGVEKSGSNEATEQDGFDVFHFTGVSVAADTPAGGAATDYSIKDGMYKLESGIQSLSAAIEAIEGDIGTNEAVVFTYANVNYLYVAGADDAVTTDDAIVKLTGVTGITGLGELDANNIYLVG